MRVIAGTLGGRIFNSPGGNRTHPMSDKMRGAIFNSLGDISGLDVLDAYAGSGALSIEAISRGAASALAIDTDKMAFDTINNNIDALKLSDKMIAMRKNISGWSRNNQQKHFDVVLVDPPYTDIRPNIIERLLVHCTDEGVMVLSWPGHEPVREFSGATIINHKSYGDSQLVFYRRIS